MRILEIFARILSDSNKQLMIENGRGAQMPRAVHDARFICMRHSTLTPALSCKNFQEIQSNS
jgi:hypothetical protein